MFQFLVLFQFFTFATLGAPKLRLGGSGEAAEVPPQGGENFEIVWSKGLFSDSFFQVFHTMLFCLF